MNNGPALYVRFWGMIDVFILTTVVFLVSYQDSHTDAAQEKQQRLAKERDAAALGTNVSKFELRIQTLRQERDEARGQRQVAEKERRKAEADKELAEQRAREAEETVKNFDSAESAAKFKELQTQITTIDVSLREFEIVSVGDEKYANGQFRLVGPRDHSGHVVEDLDLGKLSQFFDALNRVLASRASATLTMIILKYEGGSTPQFRERVSARLNKHLEAYTREKKTPVVASSWILSSGK